MYWLHAPHLHLKTQMKNEISLAHKKFNIFLPQCFNSKKRLVEWSYNLRFNSFLVVIEEIGLGVCLPGHRMALRRIVRQGQASLGTPVPGYNGKRRPLRSQQPNHSSLAMGPGLVCEFPNRPMRLLEANRDDSLKTVLLRGTKQRYIAYPRPPPARSRKQKENRELRELDETRISTSTPPTLGLL